MFYPFNTCLFPPVLVCTVMFCANCSEAEVCEVCEPGYILHTNGNCVEGATTSESGDIGRLIGMCAGFRLLIDCVTVCSLNSIYTTVLVYLKLMCILVATSLNCISQKLRFRAADLS